MMIFVVLFSDTGIEDVYCCTTHNIIERGLLHDNNINMLNKITLSEANQKQHCR